MITGAATDTPPRLSDLFEEYVRGRVQGGEIAHSTGNRDRATLRIFCRNAGMFPTDVDEGAVHRWMLHLETLAPESGRTCFATVRKFCVWLCQHGHLVSNPLVGFKPPQVRQVAWLEVEDHGPGNRIVALVRRDVGGSERVVPVPDEVQEAMELYLSEVDANSITEEATTTTGRGTPHRRLRKALAPSPTPPPSKVTRPVLSEVSERWKHMTGSTVLGALAEEYLSERVARNELAEITARDYRWTLAGFVRAVGEVDRVTPDTFGMWVETLGRLAVSSRRVQFNTVRLFCRWLVRRGWLTADPTLETPPPRPERRAQRALPQDRVRRLIGSLPDARARAIVQLEVGIGLRACEVSRLLLRDWDQRNCTITLCGKGGHERTLPVPPAVTTALEEYLVERPCLPDDPLIRSYRPGKRPLTAHTVSKFVVVWMANAGVKRAPRDLVAGHSLRHTCASDLMDACNDLRVVQEVLGHANISTTNIYLRRASLGQIRNAMASRDVAAWVR